MPDVSVTKDMTIDVALSAYAEAARMSIENYLRGPEDPGEGLLVQVTRNPHGEVQLLGLRWQSEYIEGGAPRIDKTAWLVGIAALARTLIHLNRFNTPLAKTEGMPPGMIGEAAVAVSDDGFAIWMAQSYAVEVDRFIVSLVMTFNGKVQAH